MQLNKGMIISALNMLGIKYDESKITSKGWLSIICPFHKEKTPWGAASVNLYSGVIFCQSCHQSASIKTMIEDRGLDSTFDLSQFNFTPINEVKREREIINHSYDFSYMPLEPEKFNYTRQRRYTKQYCEEFNIVHCISGEYADYIITPLIDKSRDIKTYEARKLKKDIVLKKYYNSRKSRLNFEERFEKECEEKKYKIEKGQIYDKNRVHYFSYNLLYLLKPKVLYPYGSGTWNTIFNIDNLDFDEDLWLSEGTGSHPKLYQYISKNSSALLGASITSEQIAILNNFKKRIIVVVDKDRAGYQMVLEMFKKLGNIYICLVDKEDTDREYVEEIRNCELISANKFLIEHIF